MTEKTNCKSINHKTSLKKCVEEHTVLLYEKSEILNLMVVKKNVPLTSLDGDWDWGVCQEKRPHDKTSLKKCVEEHSVLHKKQMAVQKLIAKLPRVRIGVWQEKIADLLANWIDNDKSS